MGAGVNYSSSFVQFPSKYPLLVILFVESKIWAKTAASFVLLTSTTVITPAAALIEWPASRSRAGVENSEEDSPAWSGAAVQY